ncbi:MAG: hypothetical protein R2710_23680 [Acidimicrobiales bacterium]
MIRRDANGEPVTEMLRQLNVDLRSVAGEVRETLYDLRTSVGNEKDFARTITEFANRVAERSSLTIELDCEGSERLPILQERELWRIAQESLINIERHRAGLACRDQVAFDGPTPRCPSRTTVVGFPVGKAGRQDSYGLLGMRERASSIGATLELVSSPGEGTTVRCRPGVTDQSYGSRATATWRAPDLRVTAAVLPCFQQPTGLIASQLGGSSGPGTIRLMLADDHRMPREAAAAR